MKAKTIRIKSVGQALKDFAKTYHALSDGKPVKREVGTFFASMSAARKVLTENRIQILKTIKQHKPRSLYALAKLTGRDFKNVSDDVSFLHELGLVQLQKPQGIRSQRRPKLLSDHIYFEIAI